MRRVITTIKPADLNIGIVNLCTSNDKFMMIEGGLHHHELKKHFNFFPINYFKLTGSKDAIGEALAYSLKLNSFRMVGKPLEVSHFIKVSSSFNNNDKVIYLWCVSHLPEAGNISDGMEYIKTEGVFDYLHLEVIKMLPWEIKRYLIEEYHTIQDFSILPMEGDRIKLLDKVNGLPHICLENGDGFYKFESGNTLKCDGESGKCSVRMSLYPHCNTSYNWQLV